MTKTMVTSLVATLLLVGCGGDSSSSNDDVKAHKYSMKVNRYGWEYVNRPNESRLGILSKAIDNNDIKIYLEKGSLVGEHIQFFIDSDANEATGYRDDLVDGADFLIEDGRLYKSNSNSGIWDWEKLGLVEFSNSDSSIATSVSKELIENIEEKFRVVAVSLNDDWKGISSISMKQIVRNIVSVDASIDDWDDVSILEESGFGSIKMTDDEHNLYFMIHGDNFYNHTQIYLNGDSRDSAEYLIEDNRLYKATHDGSDWPWEKIGFVDFAKDNNIVEISVSKDNINLDIEDSVVNVEVVGWDENYKEISSIKHHKAELENRKSLVINEVLASNAHSMMDPDYYKFSDWIEIHNQSVHTLDIGNYVLSDKLDRGKWTIPQNTTIEAGGYMLFWADDKNKVANGYHTNFTLKSKGESVALFDNHNNLVDGFKFGKQHADISVRSEDNDLAYMDPTPNAENSVSSSSITLTNQPTYSSLGGFYEAGESVSLYANGSTIYFTTDGSFPTKKSLVYEHPITVDNTTIVRARALEDGKLLSDETTHTYFVGVDKNLPVVSISTDDDYLFGDSIGIYTLGTNGAKTPGCSEGPEYANYFQKWKRPAHIEYFDIDKNIGFSQEVDIKISGSCSRVIPQKSLSISAKSKYGKDVINHKLFPHKSIDNFAGFKLKSAGQDWYGTMLRDAFIQQVIKDDMDVDYQDYRPCVVYLNGKYWGIHNIREKKNEHFLAENHPSINPKKVDILKSNMEVKEGSNDKYKEFMEYINNHDLTDNTIYEEVKTMMDVENYMDYIIAETYFSNADWPYENVRYYRPQKDGAMWRWMLEDLDLGLGGYGSHVNTNRLEYISNPDLAGELNPRWSTSLFRTLLNNDTFKSRFKEKYYGYLDNAFQTQTVLDTLTNLTDAIKDEIPSHADRWKDTNEHVFQSRHDWDNNVEDLKTIIRVRNETVRSELDNF